MNKILTIRPQTIIRIINTNILSSRECNTLVKHVQNETKPTSSRIADDLDLENEIKSMRSEEENTILEPCEEDLSYVAPYFRPTFNFAAYVNKSDTLKKLVDLGVNLYQIEKMKSGPELILKLDFQNDIKPFIEFLLSLGIEIEQLGSFFTKNPFIFQENLDSLKVRVNYLESKLFTSEMITRIISKNPHWLSHSTKQIDDRLGHFQVTFRLTGNQVRSLATKRPKLITYKMDHVKLNTFTIKEEMGFNNMQMKQLLLAVPQLWTMNNEAILNSFNYVHLTMERTHEEILKMPNILKCRKQRIEQRYRFLEKLNRTQFDPKKENYVSLDQLISGNDAEFCLNVAKSSVQAFNSFLKTL